jgi:putative protease
LHYLSEAACPLIGDFSLNVANSLSAAWFLGKGLARLCPSYDLNQGQLLDLLHKVAGAYFEVTLHQYMPAFHMEHCVFAAYLSQGTSYRDCGKPCESHRLDLRDQNGVVFGVKADAECRNTMFNAVPQSAARLVPDLLAAGVQNYRIEALFESAAELRRKIEIYLKLVAQEMDPDQAQNELGILERYGLSEGQLFSKRRYQDRKKTADPGIAANE